MKIFDCSQCKNKQDSVMHCLFYSKEPEIEVCSGYQKKIDNVLFIEQRIDQLVKRKAIELVNNFQNFGYTVNDWSDIILKNLNLTQIDPDNIEKISRFVRSFGANGLDFTCNQCGDVVELEDDSTVGCPSCGHSDFSLVD